MLSLVLSAFLDAVVENLPAIEQQIGRAAFLVEAERLINLLANASLAIQSFRQRLHDLMEANDRAVEAARKKNPPTGGGGNA